MYTVQCDFDDTIIIGNLSVVLKTAFASEGWQDIEAQYSAGRFSVEESNRRQFALVKATKEELQQYVSQTAIVRSGFQEFANYCRRVGIGFTIVSSGLDLYIEPVLEKLDLLDLETYSGHGRVTDDGIAVAYTDPRGIDCQDGFKLACLRYLKQRGRPIIYIGDGRSDIAPAIEADYVIARDSLREHFRCMSLHHFSFETFHDVRRIVEDSIVGRDNPVAR